jgi:hypothetical protein
MLLEVQGLVALEVPLPDNVVVSPAQTVKVPEIEGNGFIVTDAVWVHPLLFMYVISVVPAVTPVITPLPLTVATPVLEEVHGVVG